MLDNILRVNMSKLVITQKKLPDAYQRLAGRSLTSRIIADEVKPEAEPLGPYNKLVIATGLLAGTTVSCANRLSIGAKSPLTGGIKESNSGGIAAYKLGRLGIRAIIVDGIREDNEWYVLVINKEGASLQQIAGVHGQGNVSKATVLYNYFHKGVGLILVGPAGEKRLLTAAIAINDTDGVMGRFCGRGGLGAVMGAKHLVGIVIDDAEVMPERPHDSNTFLEKSREFHKALLANPQTGEIFPKYGTAAMMETTNAIGGLPTRNFSTGRFMGSESLNGQAVYDTIIARGGEGKPTHACMPGCLVRCSNVFPDNEGKKLVSPLEYETISLLGSNLEIDDLDIIARINYLCNDYGLDTIEIGCALGVAMEAGIVQFGDKVGAVKLVEEIINDTYLGKIIASGCVVAGKVLGVRRVPAVKGQGMPAYEPRAIKGTAVTYITSPMGADHTAGNIARANVKHHLKDQQVSLSRSAQVGMSIIDSLGFCMMIGPILKERTILCELINAYHGWNITNTELETIGRTNLKVEQEFNKRAGFTRADDRLPEHFYDELNPASESVFDITEQDLAEMALGQ